MNGSLDPLTLERLRRELRGEAAFGETYADDRTHLAAMAQEIRALHEKVRQLEGDVHGRYDGLFKGGEPPQ